MKKPRRSQHDRKSCGKLRSASKQRNRRRSIHPKGKCFENRSAARRLIFSLVLLCIVASVAAKHQDVPDSISSARTVAVITYANTGRGRYLETSNPTTAAQLSTEAQQTLLSAPGLSVVEEPGQADLLLLLLMANWKTQYGEDLGLIFPGGSHPDAVRRIPLWVGEGQNGLSATQYFLGQSNKQPNVANHLNLMFSARRATELRSKLRHPAAGSGMVKAFPQQLLRAKTIALFGYSPDLPFGTKLSHPFIKGSLGHSLEKWNRFKIVENAQDADLIFVIYSDEHREYALDSDECGSFSSKCGDYSREALIIFGNASPPDRTAAPLWMEQVDEKEYKLFSVKLDMIHVLREDIEHAEAVKH